MLVYLDSNIVIYLFDQPTNWGDRANQRVDRLIAANDILVVSELTRLECRVKPLRIGDFEKLALLDEFFESPNVHVMPLTRPIIDRATELRARKGLAAADAIHFAAAIIANCELFLTNDIDFRRLTELPIEVLE